MARTFQRTNKERIRLEVKLSNAYERLRQLSASLTSQLLRSRPTQKYQDNYRVQLKEIVDLANALNEHFGGMDKAFKELKIKQSKEKEANDKKKREAAERNIDSSN